MKEKMWNSEMEMLTKEEIQQTQIERLQSTMNRIYKNVPHYKKLFDDNKISPEDFSSITDLQKIPFTTKQTLRDNYPYGMMAVPLREVVRIHSSSGTTGKPTLCLYTRNDLKHWAELTARILKMTGVDHDDVVQIAFDYSLVTAGFGFHAGAELIGASVIPTSNREIEKQLIIMKDYRTSVLLCTPSFAVSMAETVLKTGINPRELNLRYTILGGEPWSEKTRQDIQNILLVESYDNYGLSEIIGPGVAGECTEKNGLHVFEDHFIPEIINPETGELVPEGEFGELVLTTITREAAPLIRYRTGDQTRFIPGECKCGRKHRRISRISGRNDDVIIFQGVKFFPYQIESILNKIEGTKTHFQIVLSREEMSDVIDILVEVDNELFSDKVRGLVKMKEEISGKIKDEIGVECRVKLVEPKTLKRETGKTQKVVDKREF